MSRNALTLFGLTDVAALSREQSVVLELERLRHTTRNCRASSAG